MVDIGKKKRGGFTLIEMLVVVAITMILAGLLFPAFSAARTTARKTKAKADVRQLDIAFRAIIADRIMGEFASGSVDAAMVTLLLGGNTKGLRYMEFDQSATNSAGFGDPWCDRKNPGNTPDSIYKVAVDSTGANGEVTTPDGVIPRQFAAWSAGPDKTSGTTDDVKSW